MNKSKEHYYQVAKNIWIKDVPENGQSGTIQGEMIRCIEKLREESQRNGNANRDCGHIIMLAYLAEVLLNESIFSDLQKKKIFDICEQLRDTSKIILEDGPYDYLTERAVDWFEVVGGRSRTLNPVLNR